MRHAAILLTLALGLLGWASGADAMTAIVTARPETAPAPLVRVEYFCSPGFVPSYGGQCVATQARDEVELFLNEPVGEAPVYHHRSHRHGLHARY